MTAYALIVVWAVIFLLRLFLGGEGGALDEAALWALRILTLIIAARVLAFAIRFAGDLIAAETGGERVFTETRVKTLLFGVLLLGVACRVPTWGSESQGVAGWTGAILICLSVIGLGLIYVRQAPSLQGKRLSYWHPYWTALLLAAWIASLIALGAARPVGTIGGVLVGLFWLSLVALVSQVIGRRLQRRHWHQLSKKRGQATR